MRNSAFVLLMFALLLKYKDFMEKIDQYRFPRIQFTTLLRKYWIVIIGALLASGLAYFGYSIFVDKPVYSVSGALYNSQVIADYPNYNNIVSLIKSDEFLDSVSSVYKTKNYSHSDGAQITGGELNQEISIASFAPHSSSNYLHITFSWKENNNNTVSILNEYLLLSSKEINATLEKNDSTGWIQIVPEKNLNATQISISNNSSFKAAFMFLGFGLVSGLSLAIAFSLRRYSKLNDLKTGSDGADYLFFSFR